MAQLPDMYVTNDVLRNVNIQPDHEQHAAEVKRLVTFAGCR